MHKVLLGAYHFLMLPSFLDKRPAVASTVGSILSGQAVHKAFAW